MKSPEWTNAKYVDQWVFTIEEFAFHIIGDKPIYEIDTEDILKISMPLWTTKTERASSLRGRLERVLTSATTRKLRSGFYPGIRRGNLEIVLAAPKIVKTAKHHKTLFYKAPPEFIAKLQAGDGISPQ